MRKNTKKLEISDNYTCAEPFYYRSLLALKIKPDIAKKAKENMLATQNNNAASACQKSDKQIDTKKEVAKLAGVSHDTIAKVKSGVKQDNPIQIFGEGYPVEKKATQESKSTAKERQLATLKQNTVPDICPERETAIEPKRDRQAERKQETNFKLAEIAGVSDKTVQRYKKIWVKKLPSPRRCI